MTVEVIDHRRVRVTPGRPTAEDVLEYAEALIDAEGWRNFTEDPRDTSALPKGPWTLHDAIGEANRRLFAPTQTVGHGKDGVATGNAEGENTRQAATRMFVESLPHRRSGAWKDEKEWENEQTDQQVIIDQLRKARGAA